MNSDLLFNGVAFVFSLTLLPETITYLAAPAELHRLDLTVLVKDKQASTMVPVPPAYNALQRVSMLICATGNKIASHRNHKSGVTCLGYSSL